MLFKNNKFKKLGSLILIAALTLAFSGCAGPARQKQVVEMPAPKKVGAYSYVVRGKRYHVMADSAGFEQQGKATWYGPKFHGRKTASGERYNMNRLTAAHKTLPFGTLVEVTNLNNGQSVVVRINDRGPFARGCVIDLSKAAAKQIGLGGSAPVEIIALN